MSPNSKIPDFKSFPEKEEIIKWMKSATGSAAVSAHLSIQKFTGGKPEKENLPKEEKKRREKIIDTDADEFFKSVLNRAPIEFHGIDAEGAKEAHPDKLGEAMPLAVGKFGKGTNKASFVADVVENTTAATHGRPDAISIAGVSTYRGITEIPFIKSTGQKANYFRKLYAAGDFRDVLSLDMSAKENLKAMMRFAKIPAKNIKVAVMDRACNETIIRQAKEIGTSVHLINQGDLAWCLKAMASNPEHPTIMMGRGGAPEGSISAIGARALGATCQMRVVENEENVEMVDSSLIWTADDFVSGDRDHSMVIFSAITQNTHFNLNTIKSVKDKPKYYLAETVVVDSSGFHSEKTTIDYFL